MLPDLRSSASAIDILDGFVWACLHGPAPGWLPEVLPAAPAKGIPAA